MVRDAFVVPLKRFDVAKDRLRTASTLEVTSLAERLALGVLLACAPRPVIVLGESASVAEFAAANGAEPWTSHARGLNEAIQGAYDALGSRFDRLIIVHGDLAQPRGLGTFEPGPGITLVTDRHGRGTNVLAIPTGLDFHFAYGPDSATHHVTEARRLGVRCHVITDSPWGLDIDEPADLDYAPDSIRGGPGAPSNDTPLGE